jgi:phosphate/sulfate permease
MLMSENRTTKPPLRLLGIVFAFALNMMLVSLAYMMGSAWSNDPYLIMAMILLAAVVAGMGTTWYVGPRSGIHAFIGGLLTMPFLALFVFDPGNLPSAILAGSFCALGGIAGEFFLRRRAH